MLVQLRPAAARRPWRLERTSAALATAACVLLLLAVAIPFIRQHQALSAVNEAVASLTKQAEEAASLRKSIDRLSETAQFLDKERGRTGDALATLAALSNVLPDDTHLTALNVHAGKVTVTGEFRRPPSSSACLPQPRIFREPAFVSPVVQSGNDGLRILHDLRWLGRSRRVVNAVSSLPEGIAGKALALGIGIALLATFYLVAVVPLLALYANGQQELQERQDMAERLQSAVRELAAIADACRAGATEIRSQ